MASTTEQPPPPPAESTTSSHSHSPAHSNPTASTSSTSPSKRIISRAHLQLFLDSPTHQHVIDYIERLNAAVVGVKLTDPIQTSPTVDALLHVLKQIEKIVGHTPPIDNGKSRFGNPAFRTFYDRVFEQSPHLHSSIPHLPTGHVTELSGYFTESWGNRTRVDYGSGMELNFLSWLLCLDKLKILTPDDDRAVVIKVFWQYMRVARLLQTEYWLEPAGSHGAQGLDDYHFAVFIFGSAQLRNHNHLRPKAIHDPEILDEFAKDYMYFSYIRYINSASRPTSHSSQPLPSPSE
ncbi:BQ2448_1133 [Microbotryum intermedium]|uniref:Serine/threonine-protein phosphatase 2A activator n=1 Tax=Microbotryum intermedium TaxID=269621 RepID=A0A238FAE2_9BASI|nr:BQ2448_1133 [Microbotryum intermedium]